MIINGIRNFTKNRNGDIVCGEKYLYESAFEKASFNGKWYFFNPTKKGSWKDSEEFDRRYELGTLDIYGNEIEKKYASWEECRHNCGQRYYYEPAEGDTVVEIPNYKLKEITAKEFLIYEENPEIIMWKFTGNSSYLPDCEIEEASGSLIIRTEKAGRWIGQGGKNIRAIQGNFSFRIKIIGL